MSRLEAFGVVAVVVVTIIALVLIVTSCAPADRPQDCRWEFDSTAPGGQRQVCR